jgi:hypothetical protein
VPSVQEIAAEDELLLSVIQGHWQLPSTKCTNHITSTEANGRRLEESNVQDEQNGLDEAIGGVDEVEQEDETIIANSTRRMQGFGLIVQYSSYCLFTDDVSSLDYLTRLRLAKVLDSNEKWTKLAKKLHCEHMIEFIKVCCEDGSPTMILLDQYEVAVKLVGDTVCFSNYPIRT